MSKAIDKIYSDICKDETCDIYYHMPILKKYADECDVIYEFGVRNCISTIAFLKSIKSINKDKRKLISVDKDRWDRVADIEKLCKESDINWIFLQASDLEIEIEECDMIFIDTIHTHDQVAHELMLHGNKARKFLAFHDTFTYSTIGEYGHPGIMPAIEKFIELNPHWIKDYETVENNGMLILKRWQE